MNKRQAKKKRLRIRRLLPTIRIVRIRNKKGKRGRKKRVLTYIKEPKTLEDSLNNIVLKYFGYTEEVKNEQV